MLHEAAKRQYINVNSCFALKCITDILYSMISEGIKKGSRTIVFVCIGTDRSTGDSLGPLIGYKIGKLNYKNVFLYGTLENPVHAKNIESIMKNIYDSHKKPYVIAIDACLGRMEHVGYITIGEGSIRPGAGVSKNLMPVGDMYVTGIVNFGGFMDFLVLQNTRLNIVMKMADLISSGIKHALWRIEKDGVIYSLLTEEEGLDTARRIKV